MNYYAGLDISNAETSICIVDENNIIVKEAKVSSNPDSIHRHLQKSGLQFEKIGLEAGALSHWLVKGLREQGWNVICIDSRMMAAILELINKTGKRSRGMGGSCCQPLCGTGSNYLPYPLTFFKF